MKATTIEFVRRYYRDVKYKKQVINWLFYGGKRPEDVRPITVKED